jgi:ribosomal protein S12
MAIGFDDPVIDIHNDEPYKSSKNRRSFAPSSTDLKMEVKRRAISLRVSTPLPKPKNWGMSKCTHWLMENPIKATADIDFVTQQLTDFDMIYKAGLAENRKDADNLKSDTWSGAEPYLRYHVMMDDSMRTAYDKAKDRAELDGRNSSQRPPDAF